MNPEAETPLPTTVAPTPGDLLRRVAAAGGRPWFPSDHARDSGVPRDDLDDPLNDLRTAGLVKVVDWVKGRGQGYGLTPDGEAAALDPAALARALAAERPPPTPRDVPVAHPELPPAEARDPGGLTAFDRGELARQALFDPPPPIVTPILILANLLWFAAGVVLAWQASGSVVMYVRGWDTVVLTRLGGVYGELLLNDEWWRLATSCFVHGGMLHLLLNLYALGVIGPVAEGLWGRWRFALIYAWSGLAGACLAMALRPDALVVGASGAVWGVMASVVAWLVLNREHLPSEVVIQWMKTLGLVLAVNLAVSFAPQVSWEAHLGGGAVGFWSAVLANVVRPGLVRKRLLVPAALLLALVPAACVTALAVYAETGGGWESIRVKAAARQRAVLRTQAAGEVGRAITVVRPEAVEAIYDAALVWAATGWKPVDLADRAKELRTAAATAAAEVERVDGTDPTVATLRDRAAAYARAVAEFAAALETAATTPARPVQWKSINRKKHEVDARWAELRGG